MILYLSITANIAKRKYTAIIKKYLCESFEYTSPQSLMSFFIRNCGSVFPCGKFVMDLL